MTDISAKRYEISNEELDNVNGGYWLEGNVYQNPEDVVFKFVIGQKIEKVRAYIIHVFTKQCTVIDCKVDKNPDGSGYCAWYKVSCDNSSYNNNWYPEKDFEGGYTNISSYTDL